MKNYFALISLVTISFLMVSCSSEDKAESKSNEQKCSYTYNHAASTMEWTAFKFNAKTPVKGTFNEINIKGLTASDDPKAIIKSLQFSIPTKTVETQNTERNGKIVSYFFGKIATDSITGNVVSLKDNGEAVIAITMNKIKKDVKGTYTLVDGKFNFSASIDVLNWKAGPGIEALNTMCKVVHTGDDGVSKLWSEVDLSFTTSLIQDCK
jgi:hypothetical protein